MTRAAARPDSATSCRITGFIDVYRVFLDRAGGADVAATALAPIEPLLAGPAAHDAWSAAIDDALLVTIEKLSARSLLAAFHDHRQAAGLPLDPERRTALDGFRAAFEPTRLADLLLDRYPVLGTRIDRVVRLRSAAWTTLARRLADDHQALVDAGLVDPDDRLVSCHGGMGDSHNGGHSVTRIELTGGRSIFYKPKSLDTDRFVADALELLSPGLSVDVAACVPASVGRVAHGWQAANGRAPAADIDALARHYYRFGVICALATALGSTDLHYENVVPAGEYPVLIDTETVLRPGIGWEIDTLPKAMSAAVSFSPGAAMLLPVRSAQSPIDALMSALGPDHDQAIGGGPLTPLLVVPDTDGMRFEWTRTSINTSASTPFVDGRPFSPFAHMTDLRAGFVDAMAAIRAGALTGLLGSGTDIEIRYVFRPTYVYGRFLDALTHPRYMGSEAEARRLLGMLKPLPQFDPSTTRRIAEFEIDSLMSSDVPCFTGSAASTGLRAGGERFDGVFAHAPIELAARSAAFAAARSDAHHLSTMEQCLSEIRPSDVGGSLLAITDRADEDGWWLRIAEFLVDAAVRDDDDRLGWITSTGDDAETLPLAGSLGFHDAGGIVEFLRRSAAMSPTMEDAAASARSGYRALVETTDADADHPLLLAPNSAFGGAASVLRSHPGMSDTWLGHATSASWRGVDDRPRDLMNGAAGALLVATSDRASSTRVGRRRLGELYALLEADLSDADRLGRPWFDLAHGRLGLEWARARYGMRVGDDAALVAAATTVGDLLSGGPLPEHHGWCNGAAGVLMAASEIAFHSEDRALLDAVFASDLVERSLTGIRADTAVDMCVCHGVGGVVQSLVAAARWSGRPDLVDMARRHFDTARSHGAVYGMLTGSRRHTGVLGYMLGWAGIGDSALVLAELDAGRERSGLAVELVAPSSPKEWWS